MSEMKEQKSEDLPVHKVWVRKVVKVSRRWQFQVAPSILGVRFLGARRRGCGPWLPAAELPQEVRQYLGLCPANRLMALEHPEDSWRGPVVMRLDVVEPVTPDKIVQAVADGGEPVTWQRKMPPMRAMCSIEETVTRRKQVEVQGHVIRNLRDLADYLGADTTELRDLNRRIYKDTDCGASISVCGHVRAGSERSISMWFHNGDRDPWPDGFVPEGFTIQSIVEGSDAEVNCPDTFDFGLATTEEVDHWIADMEAQVDELWHESNDCDEYEPDAEGVCKTCEERHVGQCPMCSEWKLDIVTETCSGCGHEAMEV